ncbi:MAG: DUF1015 domain-containing protein [Desulfuromonadales bacterium]
MNLAALALQIPEILLPNEDVDLQRWAVIACDQYTSEPDYWQAVDKQVADAPSTLRLIFPEVYLEEDDSETRIAGINASMTSYLADGVLVSHGQGCVLVDRQTPRVPSRKGLVVALDLEAYDYRPGAKTLIRATEGTIIDRLPPRIRVRRNAPVELPHIMVLIDDPEQTVIEPLCQAELKKLYDFELMQNGGHLRGWKVDQPDHLEQVTRALQALADRERYLQRYAVDDDAVMLYAMGDGNHSFATAKAIWEQRKAEAPDPAAIMDDPARYALVELVNVHDPGLEFEAIHRVVFDIDGRQLLHSAQDYFRQQGLTATVVAHASLDEARRAAAMAPQDHAVPFVTSEGFGLLQVTEPTLTLAVATLQDFLDHELPDRPAARLDYIHGDQAVTRIGSQSNNIGFYLPAISKHDLFRTIIRDGALPRKTFSMGEADEKRFYMEARRITR